MDRESLGDGGEDFQDPLIGTMVDRFRVEKKIGQGGMGAVYSLLQPAIHKRMALKLLHEQYANRPDIVQRFFGEAKAVNLIGHPNIVDISDFSHLPDGRPFIIMEFLDGVSLEEYLEERGALSVPETLGFLKQICSALGAAHAKGIVHRDIKPENFFITKDHEGNAFLKVLDFGIAKLKDDGNDGSDSMRTAAGIVLGTPTYMSPEQAEGNTQGADHRTDVYSLGIVLYQMLTGTPPFSGRTFAELIIKHIQSEPPSLTTTRDDLPPAWDRLLQKALAKKPGDRYQSMAELYDDALAAGSAVIAKQGGLRGASAKKPPLWLAFPAALVLAGGIFVATQGGRSEPVSSSEGPTLVPADAAAGANAQPTLGSDAGAGAGTAPLPPVDAARPDAVPPDDAAVPLPDAEGNTRPKQRPPLVKKNRGKGTLTISSKSWAKVYVDGKYIGTTPQIVQVKVGKHRVRLENSSTGAKKSSKVEVKKGQTVKVRAGW